MRYACVHACALLLPALFACHRHRMHACTPTHLPCPSHHYTQVMKFGSKDEDSLTKATKRSWGSLTARINKFQKEGKLPEGVIPPSEEVQAKAAKAAAAAAPPPKFSASGRPVASSSVSALVSMPGGVEGGGKKRGRPPKNPTLHAVGKTQHLSLFAGPDGLLHMSGEEVDRKLWEGAHTEGWDVVEAKANSHIQGSWRYVSPQGVVCKTPAEARQVATQHALMGGQVGPTKAKDQQKIKQRTGGTGAPRGRPPKADKEAADPTLGFEVPGGGVSAAAGLEAARAVKLTKAQAVKLTGKWIEIYWDGEAEWFESEVLAFDEARKVHFVRYSADGYECEENLMGVGEEPSAWRHVIKTTARGASAKAKAAEEERRKEGFVSPEKAPPP